MSAELDEVARSLYNGQLPSIWRALAPATLKGLGNWIIHFHKRNQQYLQWVRTPDEYMHVTVVELNPALLHMILHTQHYWPICCVTT